MVVCLIVCLWICGGLLEVFVCCALFCFVCLVCVVLLFVCWLESLVVCLLVCLFLLPLRRLGGRTWHCLRYIPVAWHAGAHTPHFGRVTLSNLAACVCVCVCLVVCLFVGVLG